MAIPNNRYLELIHYKDSSAHGNKPVFMRIDCKGGR